jgi:hypothetical protein
VAEQGASAEVEREAAAIAKDSVNLMSRNSALDRAKMDLARRTAMAGRCRLTLSNPH